MAENVADQLEPTTKEPLLPAIRQTPCDCCTSHSINEHNPRVDTSNASSLCVFLPGVSPRSSLASLVFESTFAWFTSWAFVWCFHNPYCGLLFRCGCTWNWLSCGGWCPCNVHNDIKPWCPWCRAPQDHPKWAWTVSDRAVIGLMLAVWAIARHRDYIGSSRRNSSTSRSRSSGTGIRTPGYRKWDGDKNSRFEAKDADYNSRPEAKDADLAIAVSDDETVENAAVNEGENADLPSNPLPEGEGASSAFMAEKPTGEANEFNEGGTSYATRMQLRFLSGAMAAALAFVVHGIIAGMAFWLATDYPYFLLFEK